MIPLWTVPGIGSTKVLIVRLSGSALVALLVMRDLLSRARGGPRPALWLLVPLWARTIAPWLFLMWAYATSPYD